MWLIFAIFMVFIVVVIFCKINASKYKQLEMEVLENLEVSSWKIVSYFDAHVTVKSRRALEEYDDIKFFKENREKLEEAERLIVEKEKVSIKLKRFLENNEFESRFGYGQLKKEIEKVIRNAQAYRIDVKYITYAGNNLASKEVTVKKKEVDRFIQDPSLFMGKGEYNKYLKKQQKVALDEKHHEYYEKVNSIIDYADDSRDFLVIQGSRTEMDKLIAQLFDRTVNSIKRIKTIDSEEWDIIEEFTDRIKKDIEQLVDKNQKILEYYESPEFEKIKDTCEVLMSSQREFNEYINEKVQSISKLFGKRVARTETINTDENNYIRPYKKAITPFTAEVSAAVFASAENNPLEYIVKNFYSNKEAYPEQIQKLYLLVEELETLKDAKQIIENYKKEYQQYLGDVPDFVMENDETGFYSRLGFANIDESVLTVEYKFSYTSGGGMAQRSFAVPMTEETIVELIKVLESKLTGDAFAKEQRNLMTTKLRDAIKARDNFTCCFCGNSTEKEPNLLLEIDHIIPVSKGGCTTEENLQTLCWKCNRSKGNKVIKN